MGTQGRSLAARGAVEVAHATADLGGLPDTIERLVRATLTPPARRGHSIESVHAGAVADLSEAFTSVRSGLPPGYLSQPRWRAAYLLYFVPTGVATLLSVLERAGELARLHSQLRLRVLDLGAGPLTASLALALALPQAHALDIVAVDGCRAALDDGVALLRTLRPQAQVRTLVGNLRDGRLLRDLGAFDVIVCLNTLNEWDQGGRKAVSVGAWAETLVRHHLCPDGRLVLVEPATRRASHTLLDVRAHLLAGAVGRATSPCFTQGLCPLHQPSMRDWCHAEAPWQRPPQVVALDRAIGHARRTLKSSHLIVAPGAAPLPATTALAEPAALSATAALSYRVIGGLMRDGEVARRYLCGPVGRTTAEMRGAAVDPVAAAVANAWRGEGVRVPGTPVVRIDESILAVGPVDRLQDAGQRTPRAAPRSNPHTRPRRPRRS
ncbi:MAG: hypothetical protein EXR79_10955 [Myxococcales bacterium]|nr:hypothetical protein [Myxococcales bacterium]